MKQFLTRLLSSILAPLFLFSLTFDLLRLTPNSSSEAERVMAETSAPITFSFPDLSLSAKHAVLITDEGCILYEKNAHIPVEMASTTKVMTALLACESLRDDPDLTVKVSPDAVGIEGSSVYLEEGETVRLLDLVYAVMLASANDAAVAVAEAVAGSTDAFVEKMNEKAEALGLDGTHFDNPHGLSSATHHTTAYALARLMAAAMKDPLFARITATKRYTMTSESATRHLVNHNRLLTSYPDAVGGKTGFTKRAGRCLVSAAAKDGMTLYAVTLSAPDDWNDHKALYTYGFSSCEALIIDAFSHRLPAVSGKESLTVSSDTAVLTLPKTAEELSLSYELPRFVYAPIAKGDRVGKITVFLGDKYLTSLPVIAEHAVASENPPSFWDRLRDTLSGIFR
ncbi:MAG: D-alanyl-D-alanine carboxypeptidase [Clostridia bacterium]|nr:D-alanyl-D-alanine carboxypeptidase [Clostridia bacterium]